MVPKLQSRSGSSFKGAVAYITHDPGQAKTVERVAWTHGLNLVNDSSPALAVHEMLWTFRNAELLKADAGIRPGGSHVGRPVKTFSLNWAPGEAPTKEQALAAAESFLRHMGWHEHQCLLAAHQEKEHFHVHGVMNVIHPLTGLKLSDGLERRRASAWALAFEISQGVIHCQQRQWQVAEREAAMPRPAWLSAKDHARKEMEAELDRSAKAELAFDPSYLARPEMRRVIERQEWALLKDAQQSARREFFSGGKAIYGALNKAIYREVREDFREEWATSYYAAKRSGVAFETLAEIRASLIARQKEVLEERREAASHELRKARDEEYKALLASQKEQRAMLIGRQERGLASPKLLDLAYPANDVHHNTKEAQPGKFDHGLGEHRDALDRFGIRRGRPGAVKNPDTRIDRSEKPSVRISVPDRSRSEEVRPQSAAHGPSRDIASGLAFGLLALVGGIGESMIGGHTKASRPAPDRDEELERFGIRRGREDAEARERAERDKRCAYDEEWYAWRQRAKDR